MSLVGRSKDINYVVARTFHALVAPLVGWRFTVEGQEHLDNNKPAVVLGNHQTMIDILCTFRPPVLSCSASCSAEPGPGAPTTARDPLS
jgi:1-acyl-sn-glycerol-3-phosphate acyltransferase